MTLKRYKSIFYRWRTLLLLTTFLSACGDIFTSYKKIVENYYLVDGETQNNFAIAYRTSGDDYIIKIPHQVLEYGFTDSFLVAKIKDYNGLLRYYIINRKRDFDLAKEDNFRVGPIVEQEYNEKWAKRLDIALSKVSDQ